MRILLHICCGICAGGVAERLIGEGHSVTGFFYNPNIFPGEECLKRLEVARVIARHINFEIISGEWDHDNWLNRVKCLEKEPECGRRCEMCYRVRLEKTFEAFKKGKYDVFATTLTISPLKKAEIVNRIGVETGGESFMQSDFKKKDGFKRANQIAKELNLYRQNYCGCEFGH